MYRIAALFLLAGGTQRAAAAGTEAACSECGVRPPETEHSLLQIASRAHTGKDPVNASGPSPPVSSVLDASDLVNQEAEAAWTEMASWVSANGGSVSSSMKGAATSHGGALIRGVVASEALSKNSTIMSVPRKLWLELSNFPELENATLDGFKGCPKQEAPVNKQEHSNRVNINTEGSNLVKLYETLKLKLAAAMALETRKGNASFWSGWLRRLPSLSEYKAFHPRFIGAELIKDFAGLPLVHESLAQRAYDAGTKQCLESWAAAPRSPLALLSDEEIDLALARVSTRTYNFGQELAPRLGIVPGSDLLNTAARGKLNTRWIPGDEFFSLAVTSDQLDTEVQAGDELFESYCDICDNQNMLRIWGIYLEDTALPYADTANATECGQLRPAAEAALELGTADAALAAGWASPRCKASTLDDPNQGPLRCSLARLSWEACAKTWNEPGWEPEVAALQESVSVGTQINAVRAAGLSAIPDFFGAMQ